MMRPISLLCPLIVLAVGAGCGVSDKTAKVLGISPPAGGLSQAEVEAIARPIIDLYQPLAAANGVQLQYNFDWDFDMPGGDGASRKGQIWSIDMGGYSARDPLMTPDAYAVLVCHEVGHLFAGYPYADSDRLNSVEGQADYFAGQTCLKRLWEHTTEDNARLGAAAPAAFKEKCEAVWTSANERNRCNRMAVAGLVFAKQAASELRKWFNEHPPFDPEEALVPEPNLNTPDPKVVSRTQEVHPMPQCRLDSVMAGALCPIPWNDALIPGEIMGEGRISPEAESIAFEYSCSSRRQAQGQRPTCWFKEE